MRLDRYPSWRRKWESPSLYQTGENKVKKRGAFFDAQKETAKTPRQPHDPPSCHHDFTIIKHPKDSKTPSKPESSPGIFFSNQPSNFVRLDLKHADPSPRPPALRRL